MYKIFCVLICSYLCALAVAQSNTTSRCFQFTWLGPRFNNESVFLNATCQEATRLASGVPCQEPLVASYDGSWPDVEYIWTHHGQQASCTLVDNDVCAQFTYYFNGHAENSTYMCTRATDANGTTVRNGCYQQISGSYTTRVCICRSVPGGVPCNGAYSIKGPLKLLIFSLFSFNLFKIQEK